MTEKRWKAQERRVARALNAQRRPHTGSGGPDVENETLVAEVKDRAQLPQWLIAALARARSLAGRDRLGIVVLTTPSTNQAIVCLDLADYREWYVPPRSVRTPVKAR